MGRELTLGYFHDRNELHVLRKVFHGGIGLAGTWLYYHVELLTITRLAYFCLGFAVFGFFLEFLRLRFFSLNYYLIKMVGPLLRESEVSSYSGIPYYSLGVGISCFIYQEDIALISCFFLFFADPVSSYFGIRYGTKKLVCNKSIQGSVAGFCICYLISLIYGLVFLEPTMNLLAFSILAGLLGSLSEILSVFVDDNLTIPVVSGGGLTLLNMVFQLY